MSHTISPTAPRRLGILQTTSLVTGNLVGSGVFLLPATLALFGNLSLIAWLLTGLGALMLAWLFAQMSLSSPQNGGPHHFVTEAFGKKYGYWVAWGYWVLSWISNAALIVAAVSYIGPLLGNLSSFQILALELGILCVITLINILGIQIAGRFEFIMTTLKLIPLVCIPLAGLYFIDWSTLSFSLPETGMKVDGLKSAMFLTIWAFVGLETATVTGGEIKNPTKTIPFATLCGTGLALLVYLLGSFVMLNLLGAEPLSVSKAPYADLAGLLFGGSWTTLIAIAAIICCLGSFNGWTMVVGRIAQGAADQKLFPSFFAKTDKNGTPVISLLISASCTLPMLVLSLREDLISQFNLIIDVSITLILLIYAACIFAFFKLFYKKIQAQHILIGTGSLCFVFFSIWAAGIKMIMLSLTLLILGLPMYLLQKKKDALYRTQNPKLTTNT
ncbi:MAG: amino acid permease [Candidatus Berkiella sp.]